MIEKAVKFAIKAHEGQFRKGSTIPYIIHPLEVCTIVSLMTEDMDVRREEIEKELGAKVATLVGKESEDKSKSWIERKMHTIEHLKSESIEVKMIALGDKLSNIRTSARDYLSLGDEFLLRFNEKDKVRQGRYYFGLLEALKDLENSGFYKEYENLVNFVFGDVKEKI